MKQILIRKGGENKRERGGGRERQANRQRDRQDRQRQGELGKVR